MVSNVTGTAKLIALVWPRSLYYFSSQILAWAPPLVFGVVYQTTDNLSFAFYIPVSFMAASLPFFLRVGDDGSCSDGSCTIQPHYENPQEDTNTSERAASKPETLNAALRASRAETCRENPA